jgi:hypothetical protein
MLSRDAVAGVELQGEQLAVVAPRRGRARDRAGDEGGKRRGARAPGPLGAVFCTAASSGGDLEPLMSMARVRVP